MKVSTKTADYKYKGFEKASESLISIIVDENMSWAKAIAKNVARAWNLDWELDGLDGASYEALFTTAQKFDPELDYSFRTYARRRIHEAATEAARKCKAWNAASTGVDSEDELDVREVSATLFRLFPELHDGFPTVSADGEETVKETIQSLLVSAGLIRAFEEAGSENQEVATDYKGLIESLAELEGIHQEIMKSVYWEGKSLRSVSSELEVDDLCIVREHASIIDFLHQKMTLPHFDKKRKLSYRKALTSKAEEFKDKGWFTDFIQKTFNKTFVLVLLFLTGLISSQIFL